MFTKLEGLGMVGVMVVFSFALTTVSKLPLWHMHMKYSASELLSAGLKTITMDGGVLWGAEARSVKATMHYYGDGVRRMHHGRKYRRTFLRCR